MTISRGMSRRYVLDANALIAFFEARRGSAERVRHLLGEAARQDLPLLMSAVNWGEVFYIEWRYRGEAKAREAEASLIEMPIAIIAVDRERASRAGALKQKHGLGYADAFAAELAIDRGAWLVTADPEFAKVGKGLSVLTLPRHEK
ncbi:MAG: type II toxin-antitoxin system VapC family toxin [Terriglobales bacterium]